MSTQSLDKHIALAGICQAAALVQEIARQGSCDEGAFNATINSIVVTDPQNTEQVFGELRYLKVGLATLVAQLGNTPQEKDAEVTRYIASILGLERKLNRHSKVMNQLGDRIAHVQRQLAHMDLLDHQMISNLASVYSDVVSPIGPKIQVAGNPAMLKQSSNQHKVRALLLAGVRAAVLWRQLGGQRRQILFSRRKIVAAAQHVLQQINH